MTKFSQPTKFVLLLSLIFPLTARAVLGENLTPAPAGVSEKVFNSYRRSETSNRFTRLRQFAAADTGKVFALSWTGHLDANIKQQLGVYTTDLEKYETEHPPRAGRIHYRKVNAGRVIFEFWDLPKMVKGRAYVPDLMPSKVTTDNID